MSAPWSSIPTLTTTSRPLARNYQVLCVALSSILSACRRADACSPAHVCRGRPRVNVCRRTRWSESRRRRATTSLCGFLFVANCRNTPREVAVHSCDAGAQVVSCAPPALRSGERERVCPQALRTDRTPMVSNSVTSEEWPSFHEHCGVRIPAEQAGCREERLSPQ